MTALNPIPTIQELSDDAVVDRIISGEVALFETIMRRRTSMRLRRQSGGHRARRGGGRSSS